MRKRDFEKALKSAMTAGDRDDSVRGLLFDNAENWVSEMYPGDVDDDKRLALIDAYFAGFRRGPGGKDYHVLTVYGDVEPKLVGPFATKAARDAKAKKIKEEIGEDGGIYALDSDLGSSVSVDSYAGSFFGEED